MTNRTPEESSAVEYRFTVTMTSTERVTTLDVLSAMMNAPELADADDVTVDEVER